MGNNPFHGILPKSLGNLSTSVEHFEADHCGIKGIILNEIGNLSNLIKLDIGSNELTEIIPDTLCQLRKLQRLTLGVNKLWGQYPSIFAMWYISYNSMTSTIPSTLWNNEEIHILSLAHTLLNGSLVPEIGNIKSIRRLYLSGNRFSSDIPSTIGQLQNLENLTLSNNRLHGPIPESFGNMISLKILDLSKNKLNGVIPSSMEKLEYLEYFNVSFNELIGEIPNEGPFKNFTPDIFIGNRELCGASQFKVKTCEDNTTRISNKTRVSKYILPSILIVIILAITMIYLMRCYSGKTLLPALTTSPITIKKISYYEVLDATKKFGEENSIGKGNVGSV
ncbi:probable LRR receptor-like serine threonine-kinase At3g47570 [Olea europaea subsp. europaea]|uniref:Probable LRR receptor-like serine threonine-kinase At3g47570 n=1 Tax=Olea europaea subsp. europaea TaxID=158383 RepID=A0A8S0QZ96_OLEEU|nr:probable LRR receptor-like serine threonine-kinase At3g47570 [Olea europaea subsp. europaea]